MLEEELALQEVLRATASPDALHCFQHYLYFASSDVGEAVAAQLRERGFTVESRPGADGVHWLVLASHFIRPEREAVETARMSLEQLAREHAGEYDGWEASLATASAPS
jgi:regulator of RNase E activity RraB